jgi:hypothetical protein
MKQSDPELPTLDIVGDAVEDARKLVRIEIELAREEFMREARGLQVCAILAGCAVVCALLGGAVLLANLAVALGTVGGILMALLLLGAAATTGWLAYVRFPTRPMAQTLQRLRTDECLVRTGLL